MIIWTLFQAKYENNNKNDKCMLWNQQISLFIALDYKTYLFTTSSYKSINRIIVSSYENRLIHS